jgi:hypothetical protein
MSDSSQDLQRSAPSTAISAVPPEMKWQRLTILDLLLLMLSYGVSGAFCAWKYDSDAAGMADADIITRIDLFLSIIIGGNNLASVFVLTTQYVFRHRRKWPSAGKWLWLLPLAMLSVFLVVPDPASFMLFEGILALCSVSSLVLLIRRVLGYWGRATCRWTDVFGSLTCLSNGVLIVYELLVHQGAA